MLLAELQDSKSSLGDNEEKPVFQTIAIELYKQLKNKNKKEHLRLVISSISVGVVSSALEQLIIVLLVSFKKL